jgi:hypothetical protein
MDADVSTGTFLTMIIRESVCFMSRKSIFCLQLFLCGTHGIYRNNKQHVGRESVNTWKKADFGGFREKVE